MTSLIKTKNLFALQAATAASFLVPDLSRMDLEELILAVLGRVIVHE